MTALFRTLHKLILDNSMISQRKFILKNTEKLKTIAKEMQAERPSFRGKNRIKAAHLSLVELVNSVVRMA